MLRKEDAVRSYLKTESRLQKGRYALRNTVYVFLCTRGCGAEVEVRSSDVRKVTGRCRRCADKETGVKSSHRARKRPYESLFNKFDYDRRRAGQSNSITYEDFLEFVKQGRCHYCETELKWAECALGVNGYKYNLDRKDNSQGYSVTNCVPCCWDCNELKGDKLTYEEMVEVTKVLKKMRAA